MARKSLTLVSVGPVTTESPSDWKKPCPSLSARRRLGFVPCAPRARERVGREIRAGDFFQPVDAVGVAGQCVNAVATVERDRERQQELDVAPAATLAAHSHGRLAAGQQDAGRRERLAAMRDLQRDAGHRLADVARLALDAVAEDVHRHRRFPRNGRGCLERDLRRRDEADLVARETGIARLDAFAAAASQRVHHVRGEIDLVALDDRERIGARRRIGNGRPRRNVHRTVARHVGQEKRHDLRRMTRRRKPPALDGGQVATHAIHLADARARLQQRTVDRLLVLEREAGQRRHHERRAAAGDEAKHDVVFAKPAHRFQQALRRALARGIGHRMRGLDDLDPLARHRISVARDDHTGQLAGPVILDGFRHRRRGLAGADHDQASRWWRRQERRNSQRGLRRGDRRLEHPGE